MEGGTSPELASRRIREGAVSAVGTFPVAASAADLMHPCAAEEPEAAPATGRPESFGSPGGQGGGKCGAVAAGGDIEGSGAISASGDRNRMNWLMVHVPW